MDETQTRNFRSDSVKFNSLTTITFDQIFRFFSILVTYFFKETKVQIWSVVLEPKIARHSSSPHNIIFPSLLLRLFTVYIPLILVDSKCRGCTLYLDFFRAKFPIT